MFNYSTSTTNAAELIAKLDERSTIHRANIAEIFDLCRNGCRYTNQHCDVLGRAISELARDPFRGVSDYEAGWVARHERDSRALIAEAKRWAFETLRMAA